MTNMGLLDFKLYIKQSRVFDIQNYSDHINKVEEEFQKVFTDVDLSMLTLERVQFFLLSHSVSNQLYQQPMQLHQLHLTDGHWEGIEQTVSMYDYHQNYYMMLEPISMYLALYYLQSLTNMDTQRFHDYLFNILFKGEAAEEKSEEMEEEEQESLSSKKQYHLRNGRLSLSDLTGVLLRSQLDQIVEVRSSSKKIRSFDTVMVDASIVGNAVVIAQHKIPEIEDVGPYLQTTRQYFAARDTLRATLHSSGEIRTQLINYIKVSHPHLLEISQSVLFRSFVLAFLKRNEDALRIAGNYWVMACVYILLAFQNVSYLFLFYFVQILCYNIQNHFEVEYLAFNTEQKGLFVQLLNEQYGCGLVEQEVQQYAHTGVTPFLDDKQLFQLYIQYEQQFEESLIALGEKYKQRQQYIIQQPYDTFQPPHNTTDDYKYYDELLSRCLHLDMSTVLRFKMMFGSDKRKFFYNLQRIMLQKYNLTEKLFTSAVQRLDLDSFKLLISQQQSIQDLKECRVNVVIRREMLITQFLNLRKNVVDLLSDDLEHRFRESYGYITQIPLREHLALYESLMRYIGVSTLEDVRKIIQYMHYSCYMNIEVLFYYVVCQVQSRCPDQEVCDQFMLRLLQECQVDVLDYFMKAHVVPKRGLLSLEWIYSQNQLNQMLTQLASSAKEQYPLTMHLLTGVWINCTPAMHGFLTQQKYERLLSQQQIAELMSLSVNADLLRYFFIELCHTTLRLNDRGLFRDLCYFVMDVDSLNMRQIHLIFLEYRRLQHCISAEQHLRRCAIERLLEAVDTRVLHDEDAREALHAELMFIRRDNAALDALGHRDAQILRQAAWHIGGGYYHDVAALWLLLQYKQQHGIPTILTTKSTEGAAKQEKDEQEPAGVIEQVNALLVRNRLSSLCVSSEGNLLQLCRDLHLVDTTQPQQQPTDVEQQKKPAEEATKEPTSVIDAQQCYELLAGLLDTLGCHQSGGPIFSLERELLAAERLTRSQLKNMFGYRGEGSLGRYYRYFPLLEERPDGEPLAPAAAQEERNEPEPCARASVSRWSPLSRRTVAATRALPPESGLRGQPVPRDGAYKAGPTALEERRLRARQAREAHQQKMQQRQLERRQYLAALQHSARRREQQIQSQASMKGSRVSGPGESPK